MYQLPINVVSFVLMHTIEFEWNSGSGVMLSVMRDVWCWNKLCGVVILLMQSMLNYNIYGHFNVHLSLEDTINVVTWQWGWPLDFRHSTSTPIWYVYVDVDFDTPLVDIYLVSIDFSCESRYVATFPLIHLWWVVTFTGAIGFCKCSNIP